jgi:hypothetical protein
VGYRNYRQVIEKVYHIINNALRVTIANGSEEVNIDRGGLDVNIQDQISPSLDLYFQKALGPPTTLSAALSINDTDITIASVTNFAEGKWLGIFNPDAGRFYFAKVLVINGNVISLDTPLDFAYLSGDNVIPLDRELNVDGSTTMQVFTVSGGGPGSNVSVDITRIMIHMTDATSMDDAKFAGADALIKGIVLRRVDGDTRNVWNAKSNGELANLSFDATYADKAPAGFFGFRVRYTFAGQDKHGVAVRLAPGDSLEILIQDDLSVLTSFSIIAQGHIVTGG